MSSLFRRRKVSCFYCGQHSVPDDSADYHPNGRVSTFSCPHCNADNHLDHNGEIIDYVPEPPPELKSFAHRRTSSPMARPSALNNLSTSSSSPPSPTFCTRCEHNQLILQSARNGYEMPPEDHPDYDHHVNVLYPRYMKDFEARYPPVCAECIPRVKQKLKQVNYHAKVASLGHMLARSAHPSASSAIASGPFRTVKWAVWVMRGVVWWWANVLYLFWHFSAILHASDSNTGIGMEEPEWRDCALNSWNKSELDATCYGVSNHQASRYFPWTLLGFWWLYRQWGVEWHPDKKLVGGREYLNIEIAGALIRALSWFLLGEGGWMHSAGKDTLVQMHAGFFFISFVTFLFSVTCLKLEDPPTFSLRETHPPSPEKSRPPSPEKSYTPKFSPPKTRSTPQKQHLSLTKTPPLRPIYSNQPIPPITPSYREGGSEIISPSPTPRRRIFEDEMDWDPISPTPILNKASPWDPRDSSDISPTRSTSLSSRPLTGRLSLNPMGSPDVRFGLQQTPTSIFGTRTPGSVDPVKRSIPMAEPKFRRIAPPTDTGLEGIFDGGLKLVDEPEILGQVEREHEGLGEVLGRLAILVVAGGIVGFAPAGSKVLALPAVVSAALWRMARYGGSTRILSGVEILAALVTGPMCAMGTAADRVLGNVGIVLVLAAALAEVWRLLLRMQRERKRAFWRDERKKLKQEQCRAESGSPGPTGVVDEFGFRRANSPPAFGGMSLGGSGVGSGFGRRF
ncbi:Ima1 N-terminal domain-containing protein [Trichophaea hybrida]|nr:Ima1 N-terminal domain-containing protein [Trichophaea hybrida]